MVSAEEDADSAEAEIPTINQMITAVAICKPEQSAPLSRLFGRSEFFLLFNKEDNSKSIIRNPYADTFGGAGIQTAQLLIENNIDAVIVKQIGIHALRILLAADVKVFTTNVKNVSEALKLYMQGSLTLVDEQNLYPHKNRRQNRYRFRGGS